MGCVRCLDDLTHPLGQLIDQEGLCTGCLTHEEKDTIDWKEAWSALQERCATALRRSRHRKYDCIIPLNADAEDYYIVQTALQLELNPLLVYVNNYFGTDLSWRNVHHLTTHFDLDMKTFNPNFPLYQEAVRSSLQKFNSIYWPYQAIKTAYPVKIAIEQKVPLILWGGLQATEQVGKFSHHDRVEMSQWNRVQHDLFTVDEEHFFGTGVQVEEKKQFQYVYPSPKAAKSVEGIYLSNYMRWDPWKQNHQMLKYGFSPEENPYTFDQYERAGSSVFYRMHDLLRMEKHGYRKVKDHLSREIRHGRTTQDQAKRIYMKYQAQKIEIAPFFDWLGTTQSGMESFISKRMPNTQHLIGNNASVIDPEVFIEKEFFVDASVTRERFLTYYKGI